MRESLFGVLASVLSLLPGIAAAQALSCVPPARIQRPRPDLPSADQPRRVLPIGSYTLALTWNPGWCRAHADEPGARFQCGETARFGFTLHGLWPDGYGKDWPQYCTRAAIVPPPVLRSTMCSTPSAQLIQHEWAKHGTCTAMSVQQYFGRSTRMFRALRFPDMARLSRRALTVAQFKDAFAAANPGLPTDAIRVTTTRQDWLDELWLCLDKSFRYERCKPGTGGAPASALVKIWRGER
ncbi:ribonuclease T2 family protein [Sphingomonas sp. JC676]|uniref:ribonuclease T2 family protein n=1 Tax=Sphingomonas sp. JC676 TaxID=2768065 RepID=UPI00292A55BE|nr:ribonuclease T [Sphingomonas sp. JC676]